MTIRLRGTRYQADFYVGSKRFQLTLKATDEVAAKAEELLLMAEKQAAAPEETSEDSKPWTLGVAYDKTFARCWKDTKSEKTVIKNSGQMFKFWKRSTLLESITTTEIDDWVTKLEEQGNANGTINRKLALLSKIMSFAITRGKLEKKPHLEKKAEGQGRIRYLTLEEEKAILKTMLQWSQDLYDFTVVLLDTGMRTGEAYRLEARDVDLNHGLVSCWINKASLPRSIGITLRCREVLKRRTEAAKGRLFEYPQWWYEKHWAKLRTMMQLERDEQFVPHCLRHTYASRLAQAGVSLQIIQKAMGHKTIKITERYAHLCTANFQTAAAALDKVHAHAAG